MEKLTVQRKSTSTN